MNRISAFLTFFCVIYSSVQVFCLTPEAMDEQYRALSTARMHSELSNRKLRAFFEKTDSEWRSLLQTQNLAVQSINESIQSSVDEENRKPADMRDRGILDELSERRGAVAADWQRFISLTRPTLERELVLNRQNMERFWQAWNHLASLETNWKDARLDVPVLQAAHDAVTRQAENVHAQVWALLEMQKKWKDAWETAAVAVWRPVPPE